ncbi:MAG: Crp/Fnr family transcriptional regulator [Lachnospiraceae bacterium]|nr:Crp/Fnr family transcriptional regulator [Lachnospiraceae bacterium]
MNKNLIKALRIIFNDEYDKNDPFPPLLEFVSPSSLMVFKKNQIIIEQNNSVKFFYLLLSGHASVINSITWVSDNIVDNVRALDILGLVEYLNNIPTYTAFVVALEECKVLRVSVEHFNEIIQQDVFLCYHTLQVLGRVTSENMNRAEVNSVFHPKEMLGHYLFFQAQSSGIPYTLPLTRKELSEELHINLRTLYRYLSYMETNGTLELKHGKVVIDATHFRTLARRYADIVL